MYEVIVVFLQRCNFIYLSIIFLSVKNDNKNTFTFFYFFLIKKKNETQKTMAELQFFSMFPKITNNKSF